jgi:hypothetical protein
LAYNAIVVGAPRSGTSLSAGIFARQGYFVADEGTGELRDPDRHNPFGYWEADGLITRNVALFERVGFPHHNTWGFDAMSDVQAEGLGRLGPSDEDVEFLAQYAARAPFVWKDPRLCFTVGHWWPLFDAATTRVLLIRRRPESIAQSWWGYFPDGKVDLAVALPRIEQHYRMAERAIEQKGIPALTVDYEDYLGDASGVAARIGSFFELELTGQDLNVDSKLDHSTARGRLARAIERGTERIPRSWTRELKRLTPRWLVNAAFPERRTAENAPVAEESDHGPNP